MTKLCLIIKTAFGEFRIEGESITDLKKSLVELGISQNGIEGVFTSITQRIEAPISHETIPVVSSKPEFEGVIEFNSEGKPNIIVSPTGLSGKDVIGLLLYAKSPSAMSMSELTSLVSENWKAVKQSQISAYLSHMRAFIIKEGTRGSYSYKLSGSGKAWIEKELLPRLKANR